MKKWFENKSIALIGGAKSIFDAKCGRQIDDHDVVCRMNGGINIVDEDSQGTRTDFWGYGTQKQIDLLELTEHVGKYKSIHLAEQDRDEDKISDFFVPMEVLNRLYSEKFKHPSSGIIFLMYIVECNPKSIDLYGFDWKKTKTWYFEDEVKSPHRWIEEQKFIENNFLNKENIKVKWHNIVTI